MNGDFSHFKRELGISDPVEACWDSPFDYAEQGYLLLPRLPLEPRDPAYVEAVVDIAAPIVRAARGRTFMLFTSFTALTRAAELLAERVDLPLLIQGQAPRAELLRQFESRGNAVLLGTATFWQGIDVRGPGLSCVIIDKLPFAPRQSFLRFPGTRGGHRAEAGRRPFDPRRERPGGARAVRPADRNEGLRQGVSPLHAGLAQDARSR